MNFKNNFNFNVSIIILILISGASNAVTVLPETRTTVMVSKTDINRIGCTSGVITSIDYAAGTGLTHKTHANGKNTIILFQQLDRGTTREVINSKVNMLIGCNNEYYPLILDPQEVDSQTIHLQTSQIEIEAKENEELTSLTREQVLIKLIERSRSSEFSVESTDDLNPYIYINNFQLRPAGEQDVFGTNYRIKKFIVLTQNSEQSTVTEKLFVSSKLSKFSIAALSLDSYKFDPDKDWTFLHVVIDKGAQYD